MCVCAATLIAPAIYLNAVRSSGLLFAWALRDAELLLPPVLAEPSHSRVWRPATGAAPTSAGWIVCVNMVRDGGVLAPLRQAELPAVKAGL